MIFKTLGKDTLIYGGGDFMIKMVTFVTFPIIASKLSPASFGVLELILTLVGLLGLFVNCGLNNAVQRFYWDPQTNEDKKTSLVSTAFVMQFGFWGVVAACLLGVAAIVQKVNLLNSNQYNLTFLSLIAAIIVIYSQQAGQYIRDTIRLHFAPMRFITFAFVERGLTAIAALIAVVILSKGIEGYLLAHAIFGVLVLPLGLYIIKENLKFTFDKERALEIFRYGYPFIFAGLAYWLFGSMDRWMLSSMASIEETGQYSVAFRFASIVFLASTAFGQAWSPYAMKVRTDFPDEYRKIYANVFMLLLFVMITLGGGLALFSGEIIGLVMSPEYSASAMPFAILCFAIILQSTQQITAVGISIEKKTKLLAKIAWLAAFVNLVGNYILIPIYGSNGAAIATLLSYLFITSSYMFFTQKLHTLPIQWGKKALLVVIALCVLGVSLYYNSIEIIWPLVLSKLAFALCCLMIGVIFILPKEWAVKLRT